MMGPNNRRLSFLCFAAEVCLLLSCSRRREVLSFYLPPSSYRPHYSLKLFGVKSASSSRRQPRFPPKNNSIAWLTTSSLSDAEEGITDVSTPKTETDYTLFSHLNSSSRKHHKEQLWLDLRGMALSPSEAISFLQQMIEEDADAPILDLNDLIDKVLLDEDSFFKVVSSSDKEEQTVDLLYTTNSGDLVASVRIMDNSEPQSFPIGRVFDCGISNSNNVLIDPLLALDSTSKGEWVILNTISAGDTEQELTWLEEQLCSLMEFLSGASTTATQSFLSPSSLVVPSISSPGAQFLGNGPGIAMTCRSRSTLLHMDTALKKLSLCSGMSSLSTMTDSGILLPTVLGPDDSAFGTFGGMVADNNMIATALVLPFDSLIWKTALELKRLHQNIETETDQRLSEEI